MEANKLKAAVYLRVSTAVQHEETQLPDLLNQIKHDNGELKKEHIFKDKISGLKDKAERDGLNSLLKLTNKDVDVVYIWEISRLSRNPIYFDELINHFKKRGINICFLKPSPLYLYKLGTQEEDLITSIALSIFSKFALFEIQQKVQRQQRGKREAILTRGETYSHKEPYGYKKLNKKLIVNNDLIGNITGFRTEAEVIESIFKLYTSGNSLMSIAKILNGYNIPTRSSSFIKKETYKITENIEIPTDSVKWGKRSIHNILENTVYAGFKDVNMNIKTGKKDFNGKEIRKKETNRIETPNIITKELFYKAQEQFKLNKVVTNKSYKNEFLLRGLLKCGECGKYYVCSANKKNIYKCSDKSVKSFNTKLGCKNVTVASENIDKVIWNELKSTYELLKKDQTRNTDLLKLNDEINDLNNIINIKTNNAAKLQTQSENLAKRLALVPDSVATTIIKELETLEKDIKRINKEIESLHLKINVANNQIKAINDIDNKNIVISNIDDNFTLKAEATKELLKEVLIYKCGALTILQMVFKVGKKHNVILKFKNQNKKYISVPDNLFTLEPEQTRFKYESLVNTGKMTFSMDSHSFYLTPDELFEEFSRPDIDEVVSIK